MRLVQHPTSWAALLLVAGILSGTALPSLLYLPLLGMAVLTATLLRRRDGWHDALTILIWLLIGCSRASMPLLMGESETPVWYARIEEKAQACNDHLVGRLQRSGLKEQSAALSSSLLLGRRELLGADVKDAYREVGASHLLALSGMHLGILYALLSCIIHRVRFGPWRWHVYPLILLCLWGYTFLSGMPLSLLRAALMLSIVAAITLRQGATDPFNALSVSAIVILLICPSDLFNVSFQLSFAAVFFIMAMQYPLYQVTLVHHRFLDLFIVSLLAQIGTMPLVAYYFHSLPLLAPLLSLLLIPLTTIIIYLSLLTLLLPVAVLTWCVNVLVSVQQWLIEAVARIPFATIHDLHPDLPTILLIYGALLIGIFRLRTMDFSAIEQEAYLAKKNKQWKNARKEWLKSDKP